MDPNSQTQLPIHIHDGAPLTVKTTTVVVVVDVDVVVVVVDVDVVVVVVDVDVVVVVVDVVVVTHVGRIECERMMLPLDMPPHT
jgi:hypothetical protein